jgi:hypothetical protein
VPPWRDWGLCLLCGHLFCRAHLVVRKGVATCSPCAAERTNRESSSAVSVADEERVIQLLRADVEATIGTGFQDTIVEAAARLRLFAGDPVQYEDRVVEEVQQHFHDAFVDTTWPSCPYHPNHPLWYSDRSWRCERTHMRVARLGALGRGGTGATGKIGDDA